MSQTRLSDWVEMSVESETIKLEVLLEDIRDTFLQKSTRR